MGHTVMSAISKLTTATRVASEKSVKSEVGTYQCFFKEFWKWPKWLLFARASNLGGYNHKHGHLLTGYNFISEKIKMATFSLEVWCIWLL